MGLPFYLAEDLGVNATVNSSSENSAFPNDNIHNGILGKPFRSTSTSTLWIEWNFGSATQLDYLALHGHNFTAAMTAVLKAGSSSNPSTEIATYTHRTRDMYQRWTPASHRFWRLTITDSNSDYLEIGEAPIGLGVFLPRAPRYGGRPRGIERSHIELESEYGRRFVRQRGVIQVRTYPFRVDAIDLDDFDSLDAAVEGSNAPFSFVPDLEAAEALFVRKERDYAPQELEAWNEDNLFDYQLALREEAAGVDVQD